MFSSYRDAAKTLELLKISKTGASTVRDKVLSLTGKGIDLRQKQRDAILQDNGFDKKTGRPANEYIIEKIKLSLNLPEDPTFEQMARLTDRYNNSRNKDKELLISSVSFRHNFELSPARYIYISIDEVGVKQQIFIRDNEQFSQSQRAVHRRQVRKETYDIFNARNQCTWNKGVHTAVAHILLNDKKTFVLAAPSLKELIIDITAFMLENKLLYSHKMVFFTDGARNLKNTIDEHFYYIPYTIILDWFHITRKIALNISMAYKGSIEEKKTYRIQIQRLVWNFDIQGAITYLENLDKAHLVRNKQSHQKLIDYLQNRWEEFSCYQLRKHYELPNSSSRAEKANDLLVADRQKHQGMSWSKIGSIGLAQLKMFKLNKHLEPLIKAPNTVKFYRLQDEPKCQNEPMAA